MINQDLGLKLNMLLECELPKGRTVFLHIHLPMEEPRTEESLSRGLMKEVVLMDAPQPKALSAFLGPLRFNRAGFSWNWKDSKSLMTTISTCSV